MFAARRQQSYSGVDSAGEQHILTVLRFHEVRLGKIEKHLINANKHIQLLINERNKPTPSDKKHTPKNNTESFALLKNMMTNLTEQVVVSQNFMKEIKDVIGTLNSQPTKEKKKKNPTPISLPDEYYTNHKLLELERNIAKASIISIGMEPTLDRIDEYIERNRRDRKRFLPDLDNVAVQKNHKSPINNKVISKVEVEEVEVGQVEDNDEVEDDNADDEEAETILATTNVDTNISTNEKIQLSNLKTSVEQEVQGVIDRIPVVIKPRKKRRGRPKKT